MAGVYEKGHLGVSFLRRSMCAEDVREGGFDGHSGEQGMPVGIQGCLERFHQGCVDYLSR